MSVEETVDAPVVREADADTAVLGEIAAQINEPADEAATPAVPTAPLSAEPVVVAPPAESAQSSFISITTDREPAPPPVVSMTETAPPVLGVVTKPQLVLQGLYLVFGLFVAVALTLSVLIEVRRQRPVQIAYGVGLMTCMYVLFHVHIQLSSGVLIAAL